MNSQQGYLGPAIVPFGKHLMRLATEKSYRALLSLSRSLNGNAKITSLTGYGKCLHYVDSASTLSAWDIIMCRRVYDIGDTPYKPFFLDCGANIGLAQFFWQQRYGDFESIAWEPDPSVASVLGHNLVEWGIDSEIRQTALSDHEGSARFASSQDDSGHISSGNIASTPRKSEKLIDVALERLSPYLSRRVDLLKIDIEGAEFKVLTEIQQNLQNVNNLFLEFHLDEVNRSIVPLLRILDETGFVYRIEDHVPHWRTPPFLWVANSQKDKMYCGHIYATRNHSTQHDDNPGT